MDLANKYLVAGLICEKRFDPIKTARDMSFLSADECHLIEAVTESIMNDIDEGVTDG